MVIFCWSFISFLVQSCYLLWRTFWNIVQEDFKKFVENGSMSKIFWDPAFFLFFPSVIGTFHELFLEGRVCRFRIFIMVYNTLNFFIVWENPLYPCCCAICEYCHHLLLFMEFWWCPYNLWGMITDLRSSHPMNLDGIWDSNCKV